MPAHILAHLLARTSHRKTNASKRAKILLRTYPIVGRKLIKKEKQFVF